VGGESREPKRSTWNLSDSSGDEDGDEEPSDLGESMCEDIGDEGVDGRNGEQANNERPDDTEQSLSQSFCCCCNSSTSGLHADIEFESKSMPAIRFHNNDDDEDPV